MEYVENGNWPRQHTPAIWEGDASVANIVHMLRVFFFFVIHSLLEATNICFYCLTETKLLFYLFTTSSFTARWPMSGHDSMRSLQPNKQTADSKEVEKKTDPRIYIQRK